ncbi:primosomal protein N' [Vagococcus vulneris]|uniref:Replication restart protein PriA n=1 Tax=Vagococcus vulneris TaxID=1977869 RepID=A0A429ZXF0_9ENTE|nr:primosomal protein N' [Vagococcus vulneris]RST98571.1 primosomal protein N' [Vagococcus vulneris]
MVIAHIIVDVPTMQTNQPFSYHVPIELEKFIQIGMRVEVPFGKGNRHIQGFIVNLEQTDTPSETVELKDIVNILDLTPVLNHEMLKLADYMAESTFAFKITCLQTMLPSVMRSSYKKWVVLNDQTVSDYIKNDIFCGLSELSWEDLIDSGHLSDILKLRQEGLVDIRYEVTTKNRVKTAKVIKRRLPHEELEQQLNEQRANAHQKIKLLKLLLTMPLDMEIGLKELIDEHDISRAVVNNGQQAGWLIIEDREVYRDPYAYQTFKSDTALLLNREQQTAVGLITDSVRKNRSEVFLIEGVTGSGKTEVYLQSIADVLKQSKTAIMLVPEISLTPQTVTRFKKRFGKDVAVLHSGLSQGEKYDEWRKIERGEAQVVVGARSAIFAPLENIGLIIIDEEHEGSYKQDESPRYHARDLAIWRSRYHQCPIVLGSATPSLESRARAQKNVYRLLHLSQRAVMNSTLPDVKIIDMRHEVQQGGHTFSAELLTKLTDCLAKKEQSVLMLNRRGFSSFIMCRDCGYVLPCPNCDISLTLHMDTKTMKCHYCGHEEGIPYRCPICDGDKIRYYGTGTQKVESELQELLPTARIIRMDVDTTRKKGSHQKLLDKVAAGEADILLGTQMIAKGLDFPNVTLVGVLNADTALNLPDFRSSERTFQLLTQVSGRAGRGEKSGEVLIQTYNPDHYAIQLAKEQDYESFYQHEMKIRHQGAYPPYFFTSQLVVSHEDEYIAAKRIYQIVQYLKTFLTPQAIVLGPTPRSIARVNKRYYYQVVIKYRQEPNLTVALHHILLESQQDIRQGLRVVIDMEPQHFI